jgi:hypothetical protein
MARSMTAAALAGAALAVLGCNDESTTAATTSGDPSGCKLGFLGDESAPVEMKVVARAADGSVHELADGGDLTMILPPQGGRVVFVGALATNIAACGVQLSGVLRDTSTGQLRVDERTTNLKDDGSDWGGPLGNDISTFSNIPTCPNQWASTAVFDNPFELTVTITDPNGKTASRTLGVVPRCNEPMHEPECLCQCQEDYMLGQACP